VSNLRENRAIEINVVGPVTRMGYRFKGRAEVHADGAVFDELMASTRQNVGWPAVG